MKHTVTQSAAPSPMPVDPDALLNERQSATFLGFTPRALQDWRQRGIGPRFVRVSTRAIRYRRRDLTAWTEARLVQSTADELAA